MALGRNTQVLFLPYIRPCPPINTIYATIQMEENEEESESSTERAIDRKQEAVQLFKE